MTKLPLLAVVVPCYNEQEVLPETAKRLSELFASMIQCGLISPDSKIVFVDDGSRDKTWEIIESLHGENRIFRGIKLSRNRGHQNALLAGLMTVKDFCDISVSIDADLQDDIKIIPDMINEYLNNGAQIVYAVRRYRKKDTAFKRGTARMYYKLLNAMGVNVVFDHADFRLMSKAALDALSQYGEVNLFLRGMVPLLGFKTAKVEYDRAERFAGESKYPLKKMLQLAWQGVTSFSTAPINWIASAGVLSLLAGVVFWLYKLIFSLVTTADAILGTLLILGGLQLLAVFIVGQYVGKAYLETKRRPRYIIEKYLE